MAFNFDCKLIFWRYLPKSNSGEAVSSSRLTKNHIRACTELIGALLVVQNMHDATTGTIAVHFFILHSTGTISANWKTKKLHFIAAPTFCSETHGCF